MTQFGKNSYVSPPTGNLDITVVRDSRPRIEITLDLGIPNFTVFSLKFPLVEDQPRATSGLVAEAVHVLLDEVATFMMSMEFEEEICVQMYATVLAAFKGMSAEADTSKEQDKIGADPTVKTFEGTFNLPMVFVNETQKRVVTAAAAGKSRYDDLRRLQDKLKKFFYEKKRSHLDAVYNNNRNKETGQALSDYQLPTIVALFDALIPYLDNDPLFEEQFKDTHTVIEQYEFAKASLAAAKEAIAKGLPDVAPMFESYVLGTMISLYGRLVQLEDPQARKVDEFMHRSVGATKIQRAPKIRHVELTYAPAPKTTVNDAARVIRQYRNRSLKQQPKPLYVIVYDQMGRPTGTLALGPKFKNQLLSITQKRAAVDFSAPVSFPDEQAMKSSPITGIPKTISVGGMTYLPEGVAGTSMALYHGPQDWLVKFVDGRSAIFPGRPTFRNMRRLNFPVPRNRFKWTILPPQQESEKPEEPSITPTEAPDATASRTL